MSLNNDAQPVNTYFNASRNKEKSLCGLKGILFGVLADQKLNEQELLFLDIWLRSQEHLKNDGDTIDLLDLIGDIVNDGVITKEELNELHELINDILEYKGFTVDGLESKVNELLGILSGVLADNLLTDDEIVSLKRWMESNSEIISEWPAKPVASRINEILADGIIDEEERRDLLETLKQVTGFNFQESGIAYGMATEFFETEIDEVKHEGACVCFTGAFVSGSRKVVAQEAKIRGAIVKENVSRIVNYLVVGTLASRDWRYSSHGRKIEKAIKMNNDGGNVIILTERTWNKYL